MAEPISIANIPHYISAGSPEGLRRLMLQNNLKNNKFYNYFDIQYDGKKWIAWFFDEAYELKNYKQKALFEVNK